MTMTKRETILKSIADAAATDVALQYHQNEVGFDPVKRADALVERAAYAENEVGSLRFMLAMIEAALKPEPDEGIVPAIKRLQNRAEKAERDVESLCSAARKFCAWVAAECLEDVFPLNLFECQQAIYDAFARRDARIAELESNMSLPLENARETISTAVVKESLTTQSADIVNHPPHYTAGKIECIDAIQSALTPDEYRGYIKGNVMKYVWRERYKGGGESLAKAEWYLQRATQQIPA